nr:unnamed protein product [Callosobruchus analis]
MNVLTDCVRDKPICDTKNLNIPHASTTFEEVKSFIGLNILMVIRTIGQFNTKFEITLLHPVCRAIVFGWLLGNIRHNENIELQKGDPKYDKINELRPMLDTLSETYSTFYKCS